MASSVARNANADDSTEIIRSRKTFSRSCWGIVFSSCTGSVASIRLTIGRLAEEAVALIVAGVDGAEARRLAALKREHYTRLARRGLIAVAGATSFVEVLARACVPRAVATSASRRELEHVLGALGLTAHIDAAVTAEDVRRGKPDPEVYLKAAERLGVDPAACLVFEDAIVGVHGARAAGMRVIGVTTAHTADELLAAGAERAVPHFEELRWPV